LISTSTKSYKCVTGDNAKRYKFAYGCRYLHHFSSRSALLLNHVITRRKPTAGAVKSSLGQAMAPYTGLTSASFPPPKTMRAAVTTAVRRLNHMEYLLLELKICEGCGMLWLRRNQPAAPYCSGCTQRLANFPVPTTTRRASGGPRTPGSRSRSCAAARHRGRARQTSSSSGGAL